MVVLTLDSARALGGAPIAKSSGREREIPVSAMLEGGEFFDLLSAGREHAAAPKTLPAACRRLNVPDTRDLHPADANGACCRPL